MLPNPASLAGDDASAARYICPSTDAGFTNGLTKDPSDHLKYFQASGPQNLGQKGASEARIEVAEEEPSGFQFASGYVVIGESSRGQETGHMETGHMYGIVCSIVRPYLRQGSCTHVVRSPNCSVVRILSVKARKR